MDKMSIIDEIRRLKKLKNDCYDESKKIDIEKEIVRLELFFMENLCIKKQIKDMEK